MNKKLHVKWFDQWHPDLDEALETLPEMDGCPHELYKLLIQNDTPPHKRTAIVTKKDTPVAVVGLRKRTDSYVPVTHYLLPGCLFPMNDVYLGSILESLNVNLWLSWWRNKTPIPKSRYIRNVESIPTYKLDLLGDYEKYWTSKHRNNVRASRNRCQDFTFQVNPPGGADWIIKNCLTKWSDDSEVQVDYFSDQLATVHYLEKMNRHYSLVLLDKDEFIAGSTQIVHGDDLVGQYTFRLSEYDRLGIGTRIMDITSLWAKEAGFKKLDMGGSYADYKKRWAPQEGEKMNVHICPTRIELAKNVKHSLNRVQKKSRMMLGIETN